MSGPVDDVPPVRGGGKAGAFIVSELNPFPVSEAGGFVAKSFGDTAFRSAVLSVSCQELNTS